MSIIPKPLKRKASAMLSKLNNTPKKPGSYTPKYSYLVVSAAYNVEGYLDDFFQSLVDQTIRKNSLKIIVVDDGSTDNTAAKVNEWADRYPGLIQLLQKENGGQASARNLGIDHLQNDWVCFIDPDDFVAPDYFECTDRSFRAHPNAKLATSYIKFFDEAKGSFSDSYYLRWCFTNGDSFFDISDETMPPIFSMASSFFLTSEISRMALKVNDEIRPNFEDAHFANLYLLNLQDGEVGFLKSPTYYYRKRSDGSSTIDNSYSNPDKITRVLEKGMVDLCNKSEAIKGRVPDNIVFTLLYDMGSLLRRYTAHPEYAARFTREQIELGLELMRRILSTCGEEALFSARNRNMGFDMKAAASQFFLHEIPPFQKVYIRRLDLKRRVLVCQIYTEMPSFLLNGCGIEPVLTKRSQRSIFGQPFFNSYTFQLPYSSEDQRLTIRLSGNRPVSIDVNGKTFPNGVEISTLLHEFTKDWGQFQPVNDTWIIMDSDTRANSDGEHFMRYMLEENPEQRCLFALRKESPDWPRLAQDGFPLIACGTKAFEEELRHCSKIISSRADSCIYSYFAKEYNLSKDFILLQCETAIRDLSTKLNSIRSIALMATTTPTEYASITGDGAAYNLSAQEVRLTGLPRHDYLLKKSLAAPSENPSNKPAVPMVLIAPAQHTGPCNPAAAKAHSNLAYHPSMASSYKAQWEALFACDYLKHFSDEGGRVVLAPQADLFAHIQSKTFNLPSFVEVIGAEEGALIHDYLIASSVLITDYSSMSLDAAYVQKPVIYYQPENPDDGSCPPPRTEHSHDFERSGFGPVAKSEEQLIALLTDLAIVGYKADADYRNRAEAAFVYRDGHCCERIYNSICQMHDPS